MGSLTFKDIASRENQNEFFRCLLDVGAGSVSPGFVEAIPRTEFERWNLARLHEFVELCRAVGPTRLGDAFHLWTALCNGLDYFLTTDRKFLDALRRNATDPELLVRAVSATELCAALDLPDAPLPIAENEVVPFGFE